MPFKVIGSTSGNVAEVTAANALKVDTSAVTDVRQVAQSIAATSGNNVAAGALNGQASALVKITGTWTGTVTFEGLSDGTNYDPIAGRMVASANQWMASATANGVWLFPIAGFQNFRVRCSTTGTGTIVVSISTSVAEFGIESSAWRADSVLRTSLDPSALFTDAFDSLDTTDKWTTGGTTAPTATLGELTCPAGTPALAQSTLISKPTFGLNINAYLNFPVLVQFEAGVITGNKRFWGLGVNTGTWTVAVPLTNGVGFELLDTDGALYGVVYSGSTRTQSVALTRPTDGLYHRYSMLYKTSRVYFEIDNVAVGSIALPNPAVAALSLAIGSVNGAAVLGTAAVLKCSIIGVADTSRNNLRISDGLLPSRQAQVRAGRAMVITPTLDHGALGHYRVTHRCALIATQAANSRLFELRNTSTNIIIVTRLVLKWLMTGAHTAAIEDSLDVFRCTTFSAVDTVGTVTPVPTLRRTLGMAASPGGAAVRGVTIAGAAAGMTGGTLTKDSNAFAQLPQWLLLAMPTAGATQDVRLDVVDDVNGTHPLTLATNEGFEIENRVLLGAAAGSSVYIDCSWAEVTAY